MYQDDLNQTNNTFEAGAKEKAAELGVTLITLDSQDDSATEMTKVEDLINQKVDLILINPIDSYAIKSAVEDGSMAATVEQLPKMIGSLGVENAMKVINGESVEKTIPVNLQLVTKK